MYIRCRELTGSWSLCRPQQLMSYFLDIFCRNVVVEGGQGSGPSICMHYVCRCIYYIIHFRIRYLEYLMFWLRRLHRNSHTELLVAYPLGPDGIVIKTLIWEHYEGMPYAPVCVRQFSTLHLRDYGTVGTFP